MVGLKYGGLVRVGTKNIRDMRERFSMIREREYAYVPAVPQNEQKIGTQFRKAEYRERKKPSHLNLIEMT